MSSEFRVISEVLKQSIDISNQIICKKQKYMYILDIKRIEKEKIIIIIII